ncbi:MAG: tetratricopeptide repeat protein [Pseudomonadota bacterium]
MSAGESQVTVAQVRSQIASGAIALAWPMYEALNERLGPVTDVLIVEGLLHEAEGDLDAAAASFQRALAGAPGSPVANAQVARIFLQLGRLVEAEEAAQATLRLDMENLGGLKILAEVYARTSRLEQREAVVYRLALCPDLPGTGAWSLVSELSNAGRWGDVLGVLDRRGGDLVPKRRVATTRVEALLELGRQRDALACLITALADGHVQPKDTVDRLIARRALTVAAVFVERAIAEGLSEPSERTPIIHAARRNCSGANLQDSPFDFADGARALEILLPDQESFAKAAERAALFLVKRARAHLAERDYGAATEDLVRAARVRPEDRPILEMLSEAALRAGQSHRLFDTLVRIHNAFGDGRSLAAAVKAAYGAANWRAAAALISEAAEDVRSSAGEMIAHLRLQSHETLELLVREGNHEAALAMVAGLRSWLDVGDWPDGSIDRLLAKAKRHLRRLRALTDAATMNRICVLYASIDPADLDVGRLLVRLHIRYRRFNDAADVLTRILEADPHVARDWADLALVRHELGQSGLRDACIARAIVISPAITLPKNLEASRSLMIAT